MKVELLQHGDLAVVIRAIRTCYDSMGNSDSRTVEGEYILGAHDRELLGRIMSSGHTSTIEHLNYTFYIKDVSRGLLQELARHRIASLSVKSTRYTLGRIKNEHLFCDETGVNHELAGKYLVFSGNMKVDCAAIETLEDVRRLAASGVPNDQLKYCLPESFKTELIWTINARSLRNFLSLRLDQRAHWEIRKLAETIYNMIPTCHLELYTKL